MKSCLAVVFLALLTLYPLKVQANSSAGKITEYKGSGVLERGRAVIDGAVDIGVEPMDTAVTEQGRMRIDFIDDTRVDLTEHTRLIIDDFVYDPGAGVGKLGLRATLGTVRYASGQIAKRNRRNVSVDTPSATIGVRGTDFVLVVNEIGGTMVTLLPSCNFDIISQKNECVTGEISVETDIGLVIMNQAFQSTMVQSRWSRPTQPLVLDLDEQDITNLLILRKKTPYDEAAEDSQQLTTMTDFLDIDFLEFDGLDYDALVDDISGIWLTDLKDSDFYFDELLEDMIDQLNIQIAKGLTNELEKQNKEFFRVIEFGYDSKTRVELIDENPNWKFRRVDASTRHVVELYLSQNYGYVINLEQNGETIYDYRLGVGTNFIDIQQIQ